ncbi:MAG: chemotaxis protein CheW [Lamprobacter sp.]|uniref:hybrid sensor histidine kinase/response regulator n=1 Tax=Lamprobacter sp. TaxID=3100796 RepID=UPI002B25F4E2|nr:chemotaxis protein CheW [Lamprobacter sp.]MEA3639090.1 chemotaxis protein CheW [Lamprobacter sp.]
MDELLQEFINEAQEHLATIEQDLLAIEDDGASADKELLNKVLRAAHSIKGGSGFFGLVQVKDLAHSTETVMDLMRSDKLAPNAEVINVLLAAFDRLRMMLNDTEQSEQVDNADLLTSLNDLASTSVSPQQKASLTEQQTFDSPLGPVTLSTEDLNRLKRDGHLLYLVECDLAQDIEGKGRDIFHFFDGLWDSAELLDCIVNTQAVGTLDDDLEQPLPLPLQLVIATPLEKTMISQLFADIELSQIHLLFDPQVENAASDQTPLAEAPSAHALTNPLPTALTRTAEAPPPPSAALEPAAANSERPKAPADESLRVSVKLLEDLMNLAGELVLSRNQLRTAVAMDDRQLLASVDQRINQVTAELQDVIMQTRLQPTGNVFARFPRMVRDLSRSLGKQVDLQIIGKEVALDKTLIEGLSDPLTHLVRNAVDHGLETEAERKNKGKPPLGQLRIEARYEAGQAIVEIADDGKGLDPEALAASAVRKGLIAQESVQGLSVPDKQALIFMPGFSTAAQVTDVSGRGVGMDVVKTNLDRLGGQIEIHSEVGKGSTFRIKLPLTLAIIPSLIVSVEQERFAIPQANIEELLRLRPEEVSKQLEIVGDSEVLLLRDRVLPLVRFTDVLGIVPTFEVDGGERREFDRRVRLTDRRSPKHPLIPASARPQDEQQAHQTEGFLTDAQTGAQLDERNALRDHKERRRSAASAVEIAIITTGTLSYALAVGAFHDTEEVVVKPLGRRLKHLREYSGATILGDGTVALILDMAGLSAKAGVVSVSGSLRAAELAAQAEKRRLQDVHWLLMFHNAPDQPCALPLEAVQRIERIQPEQIKYFGQQRTMQYRGGSLPLVSIADITGSDTLDQASNLIVLVSSVAGREVGLLGMLPVDVVQSTANIDQRTHRRPGIAGSTIFQDRTLFIADIHELVITLHPDWDDTPADARQHRTDSNLSILLAEDSDFFRAQVKRFLEEDGYTVLAAPDGEDAWSLLLEHLESVRVVVTDIEMPRLNGLEFAKRIRGDSRTAALPIIAVTSLAGSEDIARGEAAGISHYQVKLDREQLLGRVRQLTH